MCWQDDEVAYVGEPVVLVAAETRYLAEDAAAAVDVEYEVLPAVADCRDAAVSQTKLARGDLTTNIINTLKVGYGDIGAAFRNAALCVQGQRCGSIVAAAIRLRRAAWSPITTLPPIGGRHPVRASTQKAHDPQQLNAHGQDRREPSCALVAPNIDGGFGPKLCVYSEDVAVVAAPPRC